MFTVVDHRRILVVATDFLFRQYSNIELTITLSHTDGKRPDGLSLIP